MSLLLEKVSYLQGVADGMEIDTTTKEGKLLMMVIDLLGEFAEAYDELDMDLGSLEEYVEDVDADLANLENYVEDLDEELFEEEWDDFFDNEYVCGTCEDTYSLDEVNMEADELKCPVCGDTVYSMYQAVCSDEEK